MNKRMDAKKAMDGRLRPILESSIDYLSALQKRVVPKAMTSKSEASVSADSSDGTVLDLIAQNPGMNASTFYNLLKSKGFKISGCDLGAKGTPTVEADSGSAFPQVERPALKVERKKESANVNFKATRFLENVAGDVTGVNGTPKNIVVGFTKFKTVLLKEGMGNFRDSYFYSRAAIESAVTVFEGAKIYVDHPTSEGEAIQPERTVRDIIGHFEDLHVEDSADGEAQLVGTCCTLSDDDTQKFRALMEHAVEYAKKHPGKEFIGLSINANGDAEQISIDDLVKQGVPKGALAKLQEAKENGIESVKIVKLIDSAVSCDLVTAAGAGGKILQLLEGDKNVEIKKEAAAADAKIEAADKKIEAAPEAKDDAKAADADVIKAMVKKHMGDDADPSDEECSAVKEAYEACKEMGHEDDEAQKMAVGHLKIAKHLASKKEDAPAAAEEKPEAKEDKKEEKKEAAMDDKMESKNKEAMITLRAENAKLKESLRGVELKEHMEKVLKESKLPRRVTDQIREDLKAPKSNEEIDKAVSIYKNAFKLSEADGGGMFSDININLEKQTVAVGAGMFDDVFNK